MALTDEQIDAAHDVARRTYRHSQSGIRGQQMMPSDDPDWHFARAIESAACAERDARIAELERQLAEARKDAERLDYIQKNARNDPKMDGNHVWWPTTLNSALKGPTLRKAIDNAMQKG